MIFNTLFLFLRTKSLNVNVNIDLFFASASNHVAHFKIGILRFTYHGDKNVDDSETYTVC